MSALFAIDDLVYATDSLLFAPAVSGRITGVTHLGLVDFYLYDVCWDIMETSEQMSGTYLTAGTYPEDKAYVVYLTMNGHRQLVDVYNNAPAAARRMKTIDKGSLSLTSDVVVVDIADDDVIGLFARLYS